MACMEHHCQDCGHDWMDNQYRPKCPECGSPFISSIFDEADDRDYDYEREEGSDD